MRTLKFGPRPLRNTRYLAAFTAGVLVLALLWALDRPAAADPPLLVLPGRDPLQATTSKSARHSAVRSIPFEQLDPEGRSKVKSVLSNLTVFRRMPTRVIDCDPSLYLFLVEHPDVLVNIWEVLRISNLEVRQSQRNLYRLTEPEGTAARFEFLHRSPETHVIYAEGTYEGPLFARPAQGRCVMVLRTGYVRETNGRYYITARLDAFLTVDHGGAELFAKTFHSLLGRTADINFVQTMAFLGSLSRTAEVNSRGVQRLSTKLTNIQPELRVRLAELAGEIGRRSSLLSRQELAQPLNLLAVLSRREQIHSGPEVQRAAYLRRPDSPK